MTGEFFLRIKMVNFNLFLIRPRDGKLRDYHG